MDLANKNVVIVGSSSGLGKALANLLSRENAKLILISRTDTQIPGATFIKADIRNYSEVKNAFEHINDLDLLINCAGIGLLKDLRESTEEEINAVIDTDLKGAIWVSKEAYEKMAQNKSGYIINVVSTSGRKARPMETIYCAAKWGLRGFTESLQLAGEEVGVKVTGVYPGGMKSENFWKIIPGKDLRGYLDPTTVAQKIIDTLKGEYQTELIIERSKK
jgi:NAD(P)-dependent dehydrogenase (short-subunit alcohol dehydrogenase family)